MAGLIERLPNFVGVKAASFNSEKFLEISRAALALRPNFAMLTGVEFLLPSVPLGGVGSYSAAGSICPNLCNELFDSCVAGEWNKARDGNPWSNRVRPAMRHDAGSPGVYRRVFPK